MEKKVKLWGRFHAPCAPTAPPIGRNGATAVPRRPTFLPERRPSETDRRATDVSIMDAMRTQGPPPAGLVPGRRGLDVPRGARGAARACARGRRRAGGRAPRRRAALARDARPRGRARSVPASSRFVSSTRAWLRSAIAATSSPRSRRRGPCRATGSCGRSGSARTCSFTTARRSGPTRLSQALAERISDDEPPDKAPAWVRPFRGAARIVREVRRGEGTSIQIVVAQPYAPLLALLAHPGLAIAVPRSGGPRVGSGPYRSVELTPDRLALEAATTWRGEPPLSARLILHAGRRRCGRARRARPRRSAPRRAGLGAAVVGRGGPPGRLRPDVADRTPRAAQPTGGSPAGRRCARPWRSRSIPGFSVRPSASGRCRTPPGCRPARGRCATPGRSSSTPRERGACWPRWRRSTRR